MRLLITGGDSAFARLATEHLRASFEVRITDTMFTSPLPDGVESRTGDLRDEAFVTALVADVEAILHLAPLSPTLGDATANLEQATLGSYYLAHAAKKAQIERIVLGSTMQLFANVDPKWPISEYWRPQPQPTVSDLCAWLAECTLREMARDGVIPTVCIRLGDADAAVLPTIQQAFAARCNGWRILHATKQSPVIAPQPPAGLATRPIKNVVIFGAGGPLAVSAIQALAPHYQLRLSDLKPLEEIIAAGPRLDQHPGAPRAITLGAPHDERVADVTDAAQVMAACEGMDAIVNCTVIRHHVVNSFRVNTIGAYNVMQAAVAHNIRRVVHTGPFQIGLDGAAGYTWDDFVVDDVPARPGHGMNTYLQTKYLGQEICRAFALHYGLEVPSLFFCDFADFVNLRARDSGVHPFTTTWRDAGRAIQSAVAVPSLPTPFEILHINSDMPHGVFPNDKAKRILGWQPQDAPESWWQV
jgi:nucleoside-diphosphate-sugar epimerase